MPEFAFPDGFIFSVATSAFQIEGGVSEDGRGSSIWDTFSAVPGHIRDGATAEVACDSYHKYMEDIKILKELGVQEYRFSIAWSRVLPTGLVSSVNLQGVDYYHRLFDRLLEAGIKPNITLYHWDLPQALQDEGGWLNEKSVQWFADYARFCFEEFGNKVNIDAREPVPQVQRWSTLNEALTHVAYGHYGRAVRHAPGIPPDDSHVFHVAHHMLLAHAEAYRIYQKDFQAKQHGKVGIVNNCNWPEPLNAGDEEAAARAVDFHFGWFTHPVIHGDYPPRMKAGVAAASKAKGLAISRLPEFTEEEKRKLKGSVDYLGVNYYTTLFVEEPRGRDVPGIAWLPPGANVLRQAATQFQLMGPPGSWIRHNPAGFRHLLNHVKTEYGNVEIVVCENGCIDTPGEGLEDVSRVKYLKEHLAALSQAITEDGCNVSGYTHWSLMDNFEWTSAYTNQFGLYYIDFEDSERKRVAKASARVYANVIKARRVRLD